MKNTDTSSERQRHISKFLEDEGRRAAIKKDVELTLDSFGEQDESFWLELRDDLLPKDRKISRPS